MNKKVNKIDILSPIKNLHHNWELIHSIQSALSTFLVSPLLSNNQQSDKINRESIQMIIKIARQLQKCLNYIQNENKDIEIIRHNCKVLEQKVQTQQQSLKNHEKKFGERTKTLVEQNKILRQSCQKYKKNIQQQQQNNKKIVQQMKLQNTKLQNEIQTKQNQIRRLLKVITQQQNQLINKKQIINRLENITQISPQKTIKQKIDQLQLIKVQRKQGNTQIQINQNIKFNSILQNLGMNSISILAGVTKYLPPKDIVNLIRTNKRIRYLLFSPLCVRSICQSILGIKKRQIKYYHRHIQHFQKVYHKIPEQLIQSAYFRYYILKQSAGSQIMSALNASSLIFEGRFQGEELYTGLPDFSKPIPQKLQLNTCKILQIDPEIVNDYKQQRVQQRQRIIKLFQQSYTKIKNTIQIYRADQQTLKQFNANVLKHFSRVFVLAKALFLQAQQLQQLNAFLVAQTTGWESKQIQKQLQIQDLRAQLQAQKKLKLFFTDKSIKSQQKALLQQNLKLNYEIKHKKLTDQMNINCVQREQIIKKNDLLMKQAQKLTNDNRQIRKLFQSTRQKYQKIAQQLAVVKQTIIKMNIP